MAHEIEVIDEASEFSAEHWEQLQEIFPQETTDTLPTFSEMMMTVEAREQGHVMGAPRPARNGGGTYSACVHPGCTALLRWDDDGTFRDAQSNAHIWSCPKRSRMIVGNVRSG